VSSVQRRVVFRRDALTQIEELQDFVVAAGSPVAAADLVDALVAFAVREDAVVILGVYYGGRDFEPVLRSQDWSD